jgi:hypothetical protein
MILHVTSVCDFEDEEYVREEHLESTYCKKTTELIAGIHDSPVFVVQWVFYRIINLH